MVRTLFACSVLFGALGCGGGDEFGDADADTDTDTDTGTDTGTGSDTDTGTGSDTGPACTVLENGRYDTTGTAFGMPMQADVTVDASGCSFTFTNWNMAMSTPDGGNVVGDQVTLFGSVYWETCSGTASSTTEVQGVCEGDTAIWGIVIQ